MRTKKNEKNIRSIVEKFVADRNDFYKNHCSDKFLSSLIIFQLGLPSKRNKEISVAEAIVAGYQNEAYSSVCWLFESILEHDCGAGGNGHHTAQEFAAAMAVLGDDC